SPATGQKIECSIRSDHAICKRQRSPRNEFFSLGSICRTVSLKMNSVDYSKTPVKCEEGIPITLREFCFSTVDKVGGRTLADVDNWRKVIRPRGRPLAVSSSPSKLTSTCYMTDPGRSIPRHTK